MDQQVAGVPQSRDFFVRPHPASTLMKSNYLLLSIVLLFMAGCSSLPTTPYANTSPAGVALPGSVSFATWKQGEPPHRLIRATDGFCALTTVAGHFQGGGEVVRVYIGEDGYWYIGGDSSQKGVRAECVIVPFAKK